MHNIDGLPGNCILIYCTMDVEFNTVLCRFMQDTTPKICVYERKDTYACVRTYVSNNKRFIDFYPSISKCMPPPIRRMDGRLQYNTDAQQDNTQQIHNVFLHVICAYICSDFVTCASCIFAHNFVSGMQSYYFSESQDAIVLQTCH